MTLNEKHARPFYYYLGPFPAGFAPFLPFLALGVLDVVSRKARAGSALWMTALLFLLFSAITGKRWHYLLPLCPFAALVVGEAMDRRWNRGSFWRWASSVVIASSILGFPIFYGSLAPYFLGPNLARLAALRVNELVPRSARLICMSSLTDEVDFLGQRTVEEVRSVDELGRRLKGPQPETTSWSWLLFEMRSRKRWGNQVFLFFTRTRPSTGTAICPRPTSGKCSTGSLLKFSIEAADGSAKSQMACLNGL